MTGGAKALRERIEAHEAFREGPREAERTNEAAQYMEGRTPGIGKIRYTSSNSSLAQPGRRTMKLMKTLSVPSNSPARIEQTSYISSGSRGIGCGAPGRRNHFFTLRSLFKGGDGVDNTITAVWWREDSP